MMTTPHLHLQELWIWRDWRYMFGSIRIRYVSGEERASGTGIIEESESVKHGSHSAV